MSEKTVNKVTTTIIAVSLPFHAFGTATSAWQHNALFAGFGIALIAVLSVALWLHAFPSEKTNG
jgi:hypothetical protein